jgi:hypothetical protein
MRDLLRSVSCQQQSATLPLFRLGELNDRFDELSNEQLQEKARCYFKTSLLPFYL